MAATSTTTTSSPTVLPSFVELMASLAIGRDNDDSLSPRQHTKGHRATASFSSVSSTSSHLETPHTGNSPAFLVPSSPSRQFDTDRRATLNRKRSAARFSPYAPDMVYGHRSNPSGTHPHNPGATSAPNSPRARSPYGIRDSHSPSCSDDELPRPVRISRTRRSPYPSPHSATFGFHHGHARTRTSASSSPEQLALPILPPMPLPIVVSAPRSYDSNRMALDDNHVTTSIAQRRRHVPQGLRISTFRSATTAGLGNADGRRGTLLAHDPLIHTS